MAAEILCLNAGSSSLKFALYALGPGEALDRIAEGEVSGIGTRPRFVAAGEDGQAPSKREWPAGAALGHEDFLGEILGWIDSRGADRIVAAGHRVVHGGAAFRAPVIIEARVLVELDRLVPLAPLHQPHNLAAIRALQALRPDLIQVACFDTAFHHTLAPAAAHFALPREFAQSGVRRYGFHGLSYEYIASVLPKVAPEIAGGRVVVAHLGNGASLCAMRDGKSVDTTMGFTALDGVPMGTRCGALDPGVLLYLLQQRGMDAVAIEDLLYHRSGLLGVSGISSDMRTLLDSADPRAAEAVDLFVFGVVRAVGALAAAQGGIDGLVFTAGIGEHAAPIRARVCESLAWLGLALDPVANRAGGPRITASHSRVSAFVIGTNEDLMIARHTRQLMRLPAADR